MSARYPSLNNHSSNVPWKKWLIQLRTRSHKCISSRWSSCFTMQKYFPFCMQNIFEKCNQGSRLMKINFFYCLIENILTGSFPFSKKRLWKPTVATSMYGVPTFIRAKMSSDSIAFAPFVCQPRRQHLSLTVKIILISYQCSLLSLLPGHGGLHTVSQVGPLHSVLRVFNGSPTVPPQASCCVPHCLLNLAQMSSTQEARPDHFSYSNQRQIL